MPLRLLLLCLLYGLCGRPGYAQSDTLLLNRLTPLTANLAGPDTVVDGWNVRLADPRVDTIRFSPFRFGVWFEKLPVVVFGRLLRDDQVHALIVTDRNTPVYLYVLHPQQRWQPAGSTKLFQDHHKDNIRRIGFDDLNGDGSREIIFAGVPGEFCGDRRLDILSCSTDSLTLAASEWIKSYEVDHRRQLFMTHEYLTSEWRRTVYQWQRGRLVPLRAIMRDWHEKEYFYYLVNPTLMPNVVTGCNSNLRKEFVACG